MSIIFSWLPTTAVPAIWAMLIASILPYVFTIMAKKIGGLTLADNAQPRKRLAQLEGRAARIYAVQQNSFESLPIFLASVLVAMLFFVPQAVVNQLAVLYVLLRVVYAIAYISNLATFRSIIWGLSMTCCVLLFYLAIRVNS